MNATDAALQRDLEKLKGLLAYANPYAQGKLLEPLGTPAELFHDATAPTQVTQEFPDLRRLIERDAAPIPAAENRENYAKDNHLHYWVSGLRDARMAQRLTGIDRGKLLDFGGSTGRVFRHFLFQAEGWDVWSCDFNLTSVEWNLAHMPPALKCFLNSYYPTLPLEPGYFDLVTAFSVFTHLDETEIGWLLELRRTVSRGGFVVATIANQETWEKRKGNVLRTVETHRPDLLAHERLPEGKHVVTFRKDSPYRCTVFMTDGYVRRTWGRYFDVLAIHPSAHGDQAAVILRKPLAG